MVMDSASLNAFTDKLIKSYQIQNTGMSQSLSSPQQALLNMSAGELSGGNFHPVTPTTDSGNQDPGLGSRIIDVLSRPLYGVANVANEATKFVNNLTGENPGPSENPLDALWKGLSGQQKTTFADVIDTNLKPGVGEGNFLNTNPQFQKAMSDTNGPLGLTQGSHSNRDLIKGAGGLALDLTLDPSNLIAGGVGSAVKAVRGTKDVAEAGDLFRTSRLAEDTVGKHASDLVATGAKHYTPTHAMAETAAEDIRQGAVNPLPVENMPVTKTDPVQDLSPRGQGILGSQAMNNGIKGLTDPTTGKPIYQVGKQRAEALRAVVLPQWKASVEAAASQGVKPVVFASDGTEYGLSLPHVLEMLPENVTNDAVFGASWGRNQKNSNLFHTQIARGLAETLRVDDAGLPTIDRYREVLDALKKSRPSAAKRSVPIKQLVETAKGFVDNTDIIRQSQYETAKTMAHKDIHDAAALVEAKSGEVMDTLASPLVSTSDVAKTLTNVGSDIQKSSKEIGASANAASIAANEAADLVAKVAPPADTSAARAALAVKREHLAGSPPDKINRRVQTHLNTVIKEADASHQIPTVELGLKAETQMNGMISNILEPFRSRFSFGHGFGDLADASRTGYEVALTKAVDYQRQLSKLEKTHGKDTINTAFSAIKRGEVPADERVLAAHNDLKQVVDKVFDTSDGYLGGFWRAGGGIDTINHALKNKGIKFQFDPKAPNIPDQWKNWDITDPADFLAKSYGALQEVAAKQAFGTSFAHHFGSTVPKPGFVRVKTQPTDVLGAFIDTNKFYPKEIADQLTRLEANLKEPLSFKNQTGGLAGFVNHVVDPAMQLWKPFMTIVRPGHHVRNVVGDMTIAALDGVYSAANYRKAMQMMLAGGSIKAEGVQGLEQLDKGLVKEGAQKMSTVRLRGKNVPLSYDRGYQLARDSGVLTTHQYTEDLFNPTNKLSHAVMESGYMRGMGMISEKSSQMTRLGHFNALMERSSFTRQYNSLEDAAFAAAQRVKQFHPDVHGLTPFERKNMRRIIPFYSWIRQAAPIVFNTMLSHPGRVTMINKAQYNAATAMGLDPNSLSDSFPTDKLYPSFIRNSLIGPVGDNTMMNFGSPQEGVLGDVLNGSPWRNIVGMLNPIAKTAIELPTMTNISTGVPIHDVGEYLDTQTPIDNQVSAISGYSGFGTLKNLVNGLPQIDPQRSVARGEKEHFFNTNLANFFSGLGISSPDKPSYVKIAKAEGQTG